jgi:hypothetical protein
MVVQGAVVVLRYFAGVLMLGGALEAWPIIDRVFCESRLCSQLRLYDATEYQQGSAGQGGWPARTKGEK